MFRLTSPPSAPAMGLRVTLPWGGLRVHSPVGGGFRGSPRGVPCMPGGGLRPGGYRMNSYPTYRGPPGPYPHRLPCTRRTPAVSEGDPRRYQRVPEGGGQEPGITGYCIPGAGTRGYCWYFHVGSLNPCIPPARRPRAPSPMDGSPRGREPEGDPGAPSRGRRGGVSP